MRVAIVFWLSVFLFAWGYIFGEKSYQQGYKAGAADMAQARFERIEQ